MATATELRARRDGIIAQMSQCAVWAEGLKEVKGSKRERCTRDAAIIAYNALALETDLKEVERLLKECI